MLAPRPDADECGSARVGDDLLGLRDVDDDLGTNGDDRTEVGDRRRFAEDGLDRVAGADPPVVATVEQPDIVDAGVREDHQCAGSRDLTRASARPLLVRITFGIAPVDDDRRVLGDPERADRPVELLG